MVNSMTNNVGMLISLNDEYLYSYANGGMYAPLRIDQDAVSVVEQALNDNQPGADSCIKVITPTWNGGRFVLQTEFNDTTKCTTALSSTTSHRTKNEICFKQLCNGKCTDEFMRNVVAKKILPDLYNTKQQ